MKTKNVMGLLVAAVVAAPFFSQAAVMYVPAPAIALPRLESIVAGGVELHFLADDLMVLSGGFSWVNDAAHAGLARLRADGSLDAGYAPDLSAAVPPSWPGMIAVQPDSTVYFAAVAEEYGPTSLRRLRPDGTLDAAYELVATWDDAPADNGAAYLQSIVAGADGRLLVLGWFGRLGGVSARNVALVRADGSVDANFAWTLPISPEAVLPLPDGRWIVAGPVELNKSLPGEEAFNFIPNLSRVAVVRILPNGAIDPTFAIDSAPRSIGGGPHAFALDGRGRVVFAEPATFEASPYLRLVRLHADGGRDAAFAPVLPLIRDSILPFASATDGVPPPANDVGGRLVYAPPQARRIVAADNGAVLCFADWEDRSLRGVVGVAEEGGFAAGLVPYTGARIVRGLRRDRGGRWWAEFALPDSAPPTAGLARLANNGVIDPAFVIKVTATGQADQVAALPDGGVVLTGSFDFAGGVPNPGLAIVEGDGAIRQNRVVGALPWSRAVVVAVLRDGSLLTQEQPPPAIAYAAESVVNPLFLPVPRLGRLFPDGSWQTLVPASWLNFTAATGWLDAGDRVVVHSPNRVNLAAEPLAGDLIRFRPDGSMDVTYRAVNDAGAPVAIDSAAATADGVGVWGTVWSATGQQLVRFDVSGRAVQTIPLSPRVSPFYTRSTRTVAGVPGGAVIGGSFIEINRAFSPGLAFVRDDGGIDPDWGGWLRPESTVFSVRALGNGLVIVTGSLQTPLGDRNALLITPDGLPVPAQPEFVVHPYTTSPWFISPDGGWIAKLALNNDHTSGSVLRWQGVEQPSIHVAPSQSVVRSGEELTLGDDWFGVPPLSRTWYRNGVPVDSSSDGRITFVVRAEDDEAIFWAFVGLEGGGGYYTQPWRLEVAAPFVRLTNTSIRAIAGTADDRLILGAVLSGPADGRILARALGPALGELGIDDHATRLNSRLVQSGGAEVAPPADYEFARNRLFVTHPDVVAAARAMGAHRPDFDRLSGNDQMVYEQLVAGAYHYHVTPQAISDGGVVLAELFVLDSPGSRGGSSMGVRNFSGRAPLQPGTGVLIGGFVVEGDRGLRVLLRGIGPGLLAYGVTNAAANPRIDVYRDSAAQAGNDDWSFTAENRAAVAIAQTTTGAFALVDGSRDAAMVLELSPGIYTVVLRSDDPADGGRVGLLEIYALE